MEVKAPSTLTLWRRSPKRAAGGPLPRSQLPPQPAHQSPELIVGRQPPPHAADRGADPENSGDPDRRDRWWRKWFPGGGGNWRRDFGVQAKPPDRDQQDSWRMH
jgi:hypothetical protein